MCGEAMGNAMGREAVPVVQWITDPESKAFYGSAFVEMARLGDAERVVSGAMANGGIDISGGGGGGDGKKKGKGKKGKGKGKGKVKRARVNFAPLRDGEVWPGADHVEMPFPPIGH